MKLFNYVEPAVAPEFIAHVSELTIGSETFNLNFSKD